MEVQKTTSNLYDQDFYQWLLQQANYLKTNDLNKLDMENLTEEVESLAINIKSDLRKKLSSTLKYLLMYKYVKNTSIEFIESELLEQRLLINVILDSSPSLKQYLPELFYSAYTTAVRKLNRYIEIATPKECEWSLNQIIDENFYPK